jgi:Leucine-rich repeat (LRR) protein
VNTDINKYLKELKYLQELWLNRVHEPCTKLKEVLGTLAELEYFKFLTLSEAYIPKIPQEVLSLKNLQALYFYNIKFEEKPWIVFDVPTLEYLHFINADLNDIDEGITKLKKLKELGIEEGRRYPKDYEALLPDVNIVYIELE